MERTIRRGDIYYAELTPVIGSEQGGTRPVLIISNNTGNYEVQPDSHHCRHYEPTEKSETADTFLFGWDCRASRRFHYFI